MSPLPVPRSTPQAASVREDCIPRPIIHAAPLSPTRIAHESQDFEQRPLGNDQTPEWTLTPGGHEEYLHTLGVEESMTQGPQQPEHPNFAAMNQPWGLTGQYQTFDANFSYSWDSYYPMAGNVYHPLGILGDHASIADGQGFVLSALPTTAPRIAGAMVPRGLAVPGYLLSPKGLPKGYQGEHFGSYHYEHAPTTRLGYGLIPESPWSGFSPKHPWKKQVPKAPMHTSRKCPQSRS
ncbi:MAG: hypothetical protein Q9200_005295 [Gallowayella weberi]